MWGLINRLSCAFHICNFSTLHTPSELQKQHRKDAGIWKRFLNQFHKDKIAVFTQLTSTSDQDFGFTAGETVQQGFGSYVVVEEGRPASQLGQRQPDPYEPRLVAQEQGDRVSFLQVGVRQESPGHFVAFFVGLAVSVGAVLENYELLMRMLRYFVQKTIQNTTKPPVDSAHAHTDVN